jgi:hypothetical protein
MIELKCRHCGESLDGDETFCGACGKQVRVPDALPPQTDPGPASGTWPGDDTGSRDETGGHSDTRTLGDTRRQPGTSAWRDRPPPGAQPRPDIMPEPGTAGRPDGELNGQHGAATAPGDPNAAFFSHEPPRQSRPLNNTTRYLSAAAYLDNGFANRVIRELLASRRAVVPSVNLDLGPITYHCQRARRNLLIRNLSMIGAVVVALILSPPVTLVFALYAALLGGLLPRAHWRRRSLVLKIIIVLIAPGVVASLVFLTIALVVGILAALFASSSGVGGSSPFGLLGIGPSDGGRAIASLLFLLVVPLSVEAWYTYVTRRTLVSELALGAPPPARPAGPPSERVAIVEGAQWGNIALYATEDPFIGAGLQMDIADKWSIAIRLDPAPADPAEQVLRARPADGAWVPIDPVKLHQAIRAKLASLNDPLLPLNERIAGLTVMDRLVGSGVLRWDNPLVDQRRWTPFSHASPEATAAIIRHPQSGLRYYQHVAISDEGPPVVARGRKVLDAADMGIAISAFVYAAVEGRHLYLQYILTALPPILGQYRVIDSLPSLSSMESARWVLRTSFRRFLRDTADAPGGLVAARRVRRDERWAEREALRAPSTMAVDLGAEVSIRELGTQGYFGSYIRLLDVEKYNKILDRAILDAVQDFLVSEKVDISAFSGSASTIINGNIVTGSNNQVGGSGSNNRSIFNTARNP